MRKISVLALVFAFALGSASLFAGTLTEKVDKLIATNQTKERTYYPRDAKPVLFNLHLGLPYSFGGTVSYNIDPSIAIGIGLGALAPGFITGVDVKWYIMPTYFTPYVGGGIDYALAYIDSEFAGLTCGHLEGGIDYAFDNGFNINIGIAWLRSFAEATGTFSTVWGNAATKIDALNIQFGLGYRI